MARMIIWLSIFGLLGACSSPTVRYDIATDKDFAGVKNGQILIALRAADATFCEAATCGKWPQTAKIISCAPVKAETLHQAWNRCVNSVAVVITPTIDEQVIYVVRPGNLNPFAHTKLASTSLNDETANIDTVTVAFSDNTSSVLSSVGAGAVAGLIFGPVGAVIGGVVAAAGAAGSTAFAADIGKLESVPWTKLVCNDQGDDKKADLALAGKLPMQLALPVVVNASLVADNDVHACWHRLPTSADSTLSAASPGPTLTWSGWLYRVIAMAAPRGAIESAGWSKDYFDGTRRHDFPYVPCQNAEIQVIWWSELASHVDDPSSVQSRSFRVEIANPKFVRLADLPKGGTIKLGAVCNAQVSFGGYSGSSAQSTVDAALKAVSDYKAAQAKAAQAKPAH